MKHRTGPPQGVGGMHTTEKIGPKRHKTPEGYLLCEDVPIARTGPMIYGPNETPIKTNDLGFSIIDRDAETLFNPMTIMSFSGKSVTDNHPYGGVTPLNWRQVTVGSVHNVRRGTGDDADTLRADLLITDAAAIRAVEQGKREVSAGYDAEYVTTGTGEGRQIRIIGNHIALVAKGRCGPRCVIGDQAPVLKPLKGKANMPTRTTPVRRSVSDAQREQILASLGIGDPGEGEEDEEDDNHVHVHLHGAGGAPATRGATADAATNDSALDARFSAIEGSVAGLVKAVEGLVKATADAATGDAEAEEDVDAGEDAEDENGKRAKKGTKAGANTGDSAALQTSYTELLADAEVLVPGFRVPTFDAKLDRKKTIDSMCAIRRKALDTVNATADGATMLKTIAGATVDSTMTMDCREVASLFRSAAGAKKLINNTASTAGAQRAATKDNAASAVKKGPTSIAELNEMNRKAYPLTT